MATNELDTVPSGGHGDPGHDSARCERCARRLSFELPEAIVRACLNRQLVVFAGAGISTESRSVLSQTFYERVTSLLGLEGVSFPTAMSAFEAKYGRADLLLAIKNRFRLIDSFDESHQDATEFHRELATLFSIESIITTNWDEYFERYCGAVPIVNATDYAFWNAPGRRVFKIHGSVASYGSLVATEADYKRCYRQLSSGLIGASLKHLLATSTVLFCGYSFGDDDFNRIYRLLKREMSSVLPRSYLVTLAEEGPAEIPANHLIRTDGAFFLERLKQELREQDVLVDDSRYGLIEVLLSRVHAAHAALDGIDLADDPDALYCYMYQDGFRHGLELLLTGRAIGRFSHAHFAERTLNEVQERRDAMRRDKSYLEAAYYEGYAFGVMAMLVDEEVFAEAPLFFVWGADLLRTKAEYLTALSHAPTSHKAAHRLAQKVVREYGFGGDLLLHHRPVAF